MAVNQIILEVRRFVEFHFTSEENVMRETHYPGLLAHQALHADLLAKLGVLSARVMTQREFPEELVFFLSSWLVEHIAQEDQHVAKYVSDASVRPVAESAYGEYIVSAASATTHT